MKHEYVGDHKDFYKYSLLRHLANGGVNIRVCWMLTGNKNSKDCGDICYLVRSENWRRYDKRVFDFLKELVCNQRRNLHEIESCGLIPTARFFTDEFVYSRRREYFGSFREWLRQTNEKDHSSLIFFDPDTGFTNKSRREPEQYIRFKELAAHYKAEYPYSILLIQFPDASKTSAEFARERGMELLGCIGEHTKGLICCLVCEVSRGRCPKGEPPCILFFLISQKRDISKMIGLVESFVEKWKPHVEMPLRFQIP